MWTIAVADDTQGELLSLLEQRLGKTLSFKRAESCKDCDALLISYTAPESISLPPAKVCILPGCRSLTQDCMQVISYGMSESDSITASSLSPDRLIVSVRRDLISLSGQRISRQDVAFDWYFSPERGLPLASLILLSGLLDS